MLQSDTLTAYRGEKVREFQTKKEFEGIQTEDSSLKTKSKTFSEESLLSLEIDTSSGFVSS